MSEIDGLISKGEKDVGKMLSEGMDMAVIKAADMTPEQLVGDIAVDVAWWSHAEKEVWDEDRQFAEAIVKKILKHIKDGGVVETKQFKHEYENKSIQDWYSKIVLTPQFEAFLNGKES